MEKRTLNTVLAINIEFWYGGVADNDVINNTTFNDEAPIHIINETCRFSRSLSNANVAQTNNCILMESFAVMMIKRFTN